MGKLVVNQPYPIENWKKKQINVLEESDKMPIGEVHSKMPRWTKKIMD